MLPVLEPPSGGIIGIGIDLLEVERLRRRLERDGMDFVADVFSPAEAERGLQEAEPWRFFAGCFAAKEAVVKAIGSPELKGFYWREIEILPRPGRGHAVRCLGAVGGLVEKRLINAIHVSVLHAGATAMAVAVACA